MMKMGIIIAKIVILAISMMEKIAYYQTKQMSKPKNLKIMDINDVEKSFIEKKRAETRNRYYDSTFDDRSFDIGWNSAIRLARKISDAFTFCDNCHELIMPNKNGEADFVIGTDCVICKKCNDKLDSE